MSWEQLFRKFILNIDEIAKILNADFFGDKDLYISKIVEPENDELNTLSLVVDKNNFFKISSFTNKAYITDKEIKKLFPSNANILVVDRPKYSFALLTKFYKKKHSQLSNTIPQGILSGLNCSLGSNFIFGSECEISNNVIIEDNVTFGDKVFIENNVTIGSGTVIGDNVRIGEGTVIGSEGFGNILSGDSWIHIYHLGIVEIGNNVAIGANCCIDRATIDKTIICSGVIIDNLVHIAHNVFIGEGTAIAAKVGIAGSCRIGKRNLIGGMVGIIDHVSTTDDVVITATSTVTSNLNESGTYTGIMPITKHAKWKRIAYWITKLDKILKLLNLKKI